MAPSDAPHGCPWRGQGRCPYHPQPGERVVARDPSIARSWVGRTICACFPCMVAPQSARSLHSYANSYYEDKYYQSAIVSRKMLSQTRSLPQLHHKGRFAYELLLRRGPAAGTPGHMPQAWPALLSHAMT